MGQCSCCVSGLQPAAGVNADTSAVSLHNLRLLSAVSVSVCVCVQSHTQFLRLVPCYHLCLQFSLKKNCDIKMTSLHILEMLCCDVFVVVISHL